MKWWKCEWNEMTENWAWRKWNEICIQWNDNNVI